MDNLPDTVEKLYVFGSSLRLDSATDSDLDIFIIGQVSNTELRKMLMSVPEGEKVDIIIETEEEFIKNLMDNWSSIYQKVYEGGYKIYEKK